MLTEFKTQNGRIVLDGAGVKPDVEMDKIKYGSVARALVSKDYIFNYATTYVLENDSVTDPKRFKLTDEQFDQFLSFLDSSEYDFETATDIRLAQLKKNAKNEEYLYLIQTELDSIEYKLKKSKKLELVKHKEQIKNLLEAEVVARYFFQSGRIENKLGDDPYIKRAVEILSNPKEYNAILSGDK